jgi:hypothetical protein
MPRWRVMKPMSCLHAGGLQPATSGLAHLAGCAAACRPAPPPTGARSAGVLSTGGHHLAPKVGGLE